jgi:hypothetical protein
MGEFDSGEGNRRGAKGLESEHRSASLFNRSMVQAKSDETDK